MPAPSPAPPSIQTMLCGLELFVSWLQRTNPTINTTCASPIRVTLRQKRAFFGIPYFASPFVAIPTLVISARCTAPINVTSFCTGSSRSGRITTATSGLLRFISIDRDGLDLRRIDRRIFLAARWDDKVHAALEQRRGDHKNNEQDKREIEQGRDVNLAQRAQAVPLRVTPHNLSF